ncbi:hypothetical protein N0V83_002062 [Neocucurbitaria cava]|uniref:Uncharacterized protein n=1 Tax=Neocucurbitaria cava TaxID=798079 RepID=A0A9W8YFL3_9PLEO|nr:hypothetical protein N0V83_002062 [Neocucurbitaria cava]
MPAVRDPYNAIAAQIASLAPRTHPIVKRQQMVIQEGIIPTYYNLSGPQPGTVVGIVLGSVAGFLLIVWLLYSLTQGNARTGTTTAMAGEEEIVVRRPRRNSHGGRSRGSRRQEVREISRSPRRSGGRSQIIVDERRPPTRPRSIIVEERHRVPGDDVVEVIEEHDEYRERRGSRRGGYRSKRIVQTDPAGLCDNVIDQQQYVTRIFFKSFGRINEAMEAVEVLNDPSIPPDNGRCRLLELPRELRDLIYEYAVTEVGGLVKDNAFATEVVDKEPSWSRDVKFPVGQSTAAGLFHTADGRTYKNDHNKLKFVCKQLLSETVGLEFSCNDLIFRGDGELLGMEIFLYFIGVECKQSHHDHIRNVIIIDRQERLTPLTWYNFEIQLDFLLSSRFWAYSQAHTAMNITLRLEYSEDNTKSWDWMHLRGGMEHTSRRAVLTARRLGKQDYMLEWCKTWTARISGLNRKFPPRYRWLPSSFRERAGGWGLWRRELQEECAEQWNEHCKRWEDGSL